MEINKENFNSHHENERAESPFPFAQSVGENQPSSKNNIPSQTILDPRKPKSIFEKIVAGLNVFFTGLMVAVTSLLVYWASQQWDIMNKQWQAMNATVELTKEMNKETKSLSKETTKYAREQTEAARKSVEASKNSAEAAKQAVAISEKALKKTEEMFSLENRPYLLISSSPFDDQSYYSARLGNKVFEVGFQYEIKNIGKLAATNIVYYGELEITDRISGKTGKSTQKKSASPIHRISIAPGETQYILFIVQLPDVPDIIAKGLVETFDTMVQESGLGTKITVEYKNEIDKATAYTVWKSYKIFKKRAYTVESIEPEPTHIGVP